VSCSELQGVAGCSSGWRVLSGECRGVVRLAARRTGETDCACGKGPQMLPTASTLGAPSTEISASQHSS